MSRRTSWLALALILPVGAAVLALSWMSGPLPAPPDAPAASEVRPVAGSWICPVGDGRDGTALHTIAARPLDAGDQPAEVDLEVFEGGERWSSTVPRLFTESAVTRSLPVGRTGALGATWRDGATVLHREWTLDGDELPPGIVAGGCQQPLSDQWTIPGMVTSGGSQAILRIANPFPTDATIALRFVGTDGPVAPLALRNLSVEGRSTLEIDVNEYLPERDDLTVIVDVAAGRVAAQGLQLVRSAIGGVDGVSVLDAAPVPAEIWTVPWVVDREGGRSWLWVYNPSERVAPVELSYHTLTGGDLPAGLTEVLVEPGQLRRIDLRGTLPEDDEVVAVTARSDGAPVVVAGAVELAAEDAERTAFTVQLGIPQADTSWTVSGGPTAGRVEQLHLVNPGSEPATASVSLFTGVTVERPDDLQEMTVPAGGRAVVVVADGQRELDAWTAFVTTSAGELVVGRVGGAGEGPRRQVAVAGVPAAAWTTQSAESRLLRAEGLTQRLRTSLGIAEGEPVLAPSSPDAEPEELAPTPLPDDDDGPPPAGEEDVEDPAAEAPEEDEDVEEDTSAPVGDLPGDAPGAGAGLDGQAPGDDADGDADTETGDDGEG